ncbi:MAG TPA: ATP-binding protein [Burkholderiales bacterium]|nr:ATP-binding protein [Burkholderiales bacterium]
MFYARLSELGLISRFLEGFCDEAGIERTHRLRLNVVLEELFVNTVRHGHRGDCDAPVWLHIGAVDGSMRVTYEDTAPPFNPYARLPTAPPDTTLEMRKIGGLGLLLTKELASQRDYAYVFGRNRIRLAMKAR